MKDVICSVEERLKAEECKLTPRREAILKVLLENKDKHLSAEEVYYLVKKKTPDVGLATVYRTLELFTNHDIIHSIDFGDGRKRYEYGDSESQGHHHHHVICLTCGKILEVAEDLLDEIELRVSREFDFEVLNHQLKIFGQCKECK